MLMRHSRVEEDGTYVPPRNAKLTWGTMTLIRTDIVVSDWVNGRGGWGVGWRPNVGY